MMRLSREVDDLGLSFRWSKSFLAAPQYPLTEGLEACPAICLPLDELQAMHVTFDGPCDQNSVSPALTAVVVFFERLCEVAEFCDSLLFGLLEPGIKAFPLPLSEHARKFLDQFVGLSDLLICLTQLCQVLLLPLQTSALP